MLKGAYIHIYCLCLCYYDILLYYMHICYIYNVGALWQAIYRMLIGHMSAIYDWLLI